MEIHISKLLYGQFARIVRWKEASTGYSPTLHGHLVYKCWGGLVDLTQDRFWGSKHEFAPECSVELVEPGEFVLIRVADAPVSPAKDNGPRHGFVVTGDRRLTF